jgi:signal transduction histidine kinase
MLSQGDELSTIDVVNGVEMGWTGHASVLADPEVGVMLLSSTGHLHTATQAACELFGATQVDELRAIVERFAGLFVDVGRLSTGASRSVEVEGRVHGAPRVVRCDVRTLSGDERCALLVLAQPAGRAEAIETAVRLASRAQMLRAVQAIAAHDFRDSLNSISINLELMSRTFEPGPVSERNAELQQHCLRALRQELTRLAASTGNALEESIVPVGEGRRVALADVILSTIAVLRSRAQRQRVTVHFDAPTTHIEVVGHRDQLRHAVFNLATNALEAMPGGGELRFDLTIEGGTAVLSVSDTGTGIPDEVRSKVWDLLFSTKEEGLGLGLHVVKNVAASHGGSVELDRRETGLTCAMRLPVA